MIRLACPGPRSKPNRARLGRIEEKTWDLLRTPKKSGGIIAASTERMGSDISKYPSQSCRVNAEAN